MGLYCGDCGAWLKWISKKELPLVERFLKNNKEEEKQCLYCHGLKPLYEDSGITISFRNRKFYAVDELNFNQLDWKHCPMCGKKIEEEC